MRRTKRLKTGPIILVALAAGAALLLLVGLGVFGYFYQSGGVPTATILEPVHGQIVTSGEGMMVMVGGKAARGLESLEFYVNDVFHARLDNFEGTKGAYQAAFPWYSSRVGVNKLSVVAYDLQGRASAETVAWVGVKPVHAFQADPAVEEESEDGASQAVGEQPEGDGAVDGAQGEQATQPTAAPQGGGEAPPTEGAPDAPIEPGGGGEVVSEQQIEANPNFLEHILVEEMLNLDQIDGNLPLDENNPPGDEPPTVSMDPSTIRTNGGLDVTLHITAEDDLGVDYIMVSVFSGSAQPETHIQLCAGLEHCVDAYHYFIPSGERYIAVQAFDTSGQASNTLAQVFMVMPEQGDDVAFVISDEADIGSLEAWDGPELHPSRDDFGELSIYDYPCFGLDVILEVPFRYVSDHGRYVYATAWAMKDGIRYARGFARVARYTTGLVHFEMEKRPELDSLATTDEVWLEFRTDDPYEGDPFYTERTELTINWNPGLPELRILEVTRSPMGDSLEIEVENQGCEPVYGFDLHFRPNAPASFRRSFASTVPAGEVITFMIENIPPTAFSTAFDVEIDPENVIREIDERNNVHHTPPIRLDYVHIYQIDIHNTSDGEWHQNADQGEFQLRFGANDSHARRRLSLSKGSHQIDSRVAPIILYPEVDSFDDVVILLEVVELDDYGPDDRQYFTFRHPFQMEEENSWKHGYGISYSATSNNGYYTVHWWIVLEEQQ